MNLFLAALLLVQDKTAEETFKKIEETLSNAKTISLKFTLSDIKRDNGEEVRTITSGTLMLKEGNRVRLQAESKFGLVVLPANPARN